MSDHFKNIYIHEADRYDLLVSREDHQQNILPALESIRSLAGCDVVEMGAGTGRLTRLLVPHVKSIRAYDASAHMLSKAKATLEAIGRTNWALAVGENHDLPAADAIADIAIAGWSFGHCCGWFPERWCEEISQALREMNRVLRPGGTAIILETLGTGLETPLPPNDALAAYYDWLESEQGFSATSIRTDYRFASAQEADELTRFFFDNEFANCFLDDKREILPECTGIWWKAF